MAIWEVLMGAPLTVLTRLILSVIPVLNTFHPLDNRRSNGFEFIAAELLDLNVRTDWSYERIPSLGDRIAI